MTTEFDVIVIGVGSMGSAACYYLSRWGQRVLGLEQFGITHELGSHAGQSRIIRKAYFENSDYVPLLTRAYENWKELETETRQQVYFETGLAYFGLPDHALISGVKKSASLYQVEVEDLDIVQRKTRFPHFQLPREFETLFEPAAGLLTPAKAIQLYAGQATKNGAQIHINEKVISWKKEGSGISVVTNYETYHCHRLVITAGAWAGKLFPAFSKKIRVTRQFLAWITPKSSREFQLGRFPCWLLEDDHRPGCYYGFPILPPNEFGEPTGLKLARHYPAIETDPDQVNRNILDEDLEDLHYCLDKYFPGVFESMVESKVCLYANSPDEDFIIDKMPGFEEQVVIACGFSGHGFKFASVVGEILAELSIQGTTRFPIGFLNAQRFSS